MNKLLFILLIILSIPTLHAQRDTTFYRHEVKASISDALQVMFSGFPISTTLEKMRIYTLMLLFPIFIVL